MAVRGWWLLAVLFDGGGAVRERVTGVVERVTCNYNYSCSSSCPVTLCSSPLVVTLGGSGGLGRVLHPQQIVHTLPSSLTFVVW